MHDKEIKKNFQNVKMLRNAVLTVLCIVLGIVVAFEYKSVKSSLENGEKTEMSSSDYLVKIAELGETIDTLETQKNELENKLKAFENSTNEERIAELEKQNQSLRAYSCLTDVEAEGVIITIEYGASADISGSNFLLLTLINELKAAEAQAIAVNGDRLHAMSEVRAVNDTLVVNGNSYYAPVTVSVVGDATKIISAINMSGISSSFTNYLGENGNFNVEYSSSVSIPALSESYLQSVTNNLTGE